MQTQNQIEIPSVAAPSQVTKEQSSGTDTAALGSSKVTNNLQEGVQGQQVQMQSRVGVDTILSQETSQMENPLASILTSTSNDSQQSKGSQTGNKSLIMKINVNNPTIRNLNLPAKFRQDVIGSISILESSRDQLRSDKSKQEEQEQIRDKLVQSSLYKVLSDAVTTPDIDQQRLSSDPTVKIVKRPLDQDTVVKVFIQDWKPVVCKQTQQFLHSNDDTHKSEYKNFGANNILRSKNNPYKRDQQRQQSNQRASSQERNRSKNEMRVDTTVPQSKPTKFIHVNEIEFSGSKTPPDSIRSPETQSKFASRVTFHEAAGPTSKQMDSSFRGLQGPILLNSSSESLNSRLVQETQVEETVQTVRKEPSDLTVSQSRKMNPKLTLNIPNSLQDNSASKQNYSHINIDHSVLDVNTARPNDTQRSSNVVKVPNVTNPENQNHEYLTLGSVDSFDKDSTSKPRAAKVQEPQSASILNKTAILKAHNVQTDLKPFVALCPPSQFSFEEKKKVIQKNFFKFGTSQHLSKHDMTELDQRSTSKNEDLMHIVQPHVSLRDRSANRSPIDRSVDNPSKIYTEFTSNTPDKPAQNVNMFINAQQQTQVQVKQLTLDSPQNQETLVQRSDQKFKENRATQGNADKHSPSARDSKLKKVSRENSPDRRTILQNNNQNKSQKRPTKPNKMVITSKDISPSPDKNEQSPTEKRETLRDSKLNDEAQINNRKMRLRKQEAITQAKKKALEHRLSKIIEFKSEPEQLMIVSPAPTKPKLADSPQRVNSPTQVSNERYKSPQNQHNLSQDFHNTSEQSGSIFLQLSRRYISPSPVPIPPGQLECPNMTHTITDDHNGQDQDEKQKLLSKDESSNSNNQVRVRRFMFGEHQKSDNNVPSNQVSQFNVANQSSNQTPCDSSSVYRDNTRFSPPIKFTLNSDQNGQQRAMNTSQYKNHLIVEAREKLDVTELMNKTATDQHMSNTKSDDQLNGLQQPSNNELFAVNSKHLMNESTNFNREFVNTSQTVHRRQDQANKKRKMLEQIDQFAKTSYSRFHMKTNNSALPNMGRNNEKLRSRDKSELQKNKSLIKGGKKGDHAVVEDAVFDTVSDDTRYGNSCHQKKSIAHCSINDSQHSDQQLKQLNNNIKVVELSHVPDKKDFIDIPGQSINTIATGNTSFRNKQNEQMDKYLRMTSFIDQMFKQNQNNNRNPIQSKSKNAQMKKHTGWNKFMMVGFKTQTQLTPVESPKNLVSSPILQSRVHTKKPMDTRKSMPARSDLSHKIDEEPNDKMLEYISTTSAHLHPFNHSLINQNFELLKHKKNQINKQVRLGSNAGMNVEERKQILTSTVNRMNHRLNLVKQEDSGGSPVSLMYDELLGQGQMSLQEQSLHMSKPQLNSSFNQRAQLSPASSIKPVQIYDSFSSLEKALSSRQDLQLNEQQSSIFQMRPLATKRFDEEDQATANMAASSPKITNLVSSGENVIAMLMDMQHLKTESSANSPRETALQQAAIPPTADLRTSSQEEAVAHSGATKLGQTAAQVTSPLMDKSRQNSLSSVYKQLHQGGPRTQRNWNLLRQVISHQQQQDPEKNKIGLRRVTRNVASGANSSLNQPLTLRSEEDKLNVDLVRDGATSSQNRQQFSPSEEMDLQNSNQNVRNMRLPPVKTKPLTVKDDANSNVESPLLDSIFPPVMSPKQNQFSSRSVFKPFKASNTRMHKSNVRQNVKKKLTNRV